MPHYTIDITDKALARRVSPRSRPRRKADVLQLLEFEPGVARAVDILTFCLRCDSGDALNALLDVSTRLQRPVSEIADGLVATLQAGGPSVLVPWMRGRRQPPVVHGAGAPSGHSAHAGAGR